MVDDFASAQVLAATQTPGDAGKKWFQGTADAVRQFGWLFEVCFYLLFVKKKKNNGSIGRVSYDSNGDEF